MYKIFVLLVAAGVVSVFALGKKPGSVTHNSTSGPAFPTPTPFAHQDLTIPHLKSRKYASRLGELKMHSRKGSYTSYLTDYDSDGLKINGLLTVPNGSKPDGGYPAIVFVHGYINPRSYGTTRNYEVYVDRLASSGFVVFKIDLRGHGNSEGEASGAYYSSDYVVDTLHAIAALESYSMINPKAIGLWGHSMAGNIVLRSIVSHGQIKSSVIWAGAGYTYTDLIAYRIKDQSYRPPTPNTARSKKRQQLRETYGEFDPQHFFWKQVAPTNYLDGIPTLIQLHHATNDDVVSIEYSRNISRLLEESGISNQLYEYSTGGHNISGTSFQTAMSRTVEFFNTTLR